MLGFRIFCEFGIPIQVPEWLGRRVIIAVDSELDQQNCQGMCYCLCILFLFDMTNDVDERVIGKAREVLALAGPGKGLEWARILGKLDV